MVHPEVLTCSLDPQPCPSAIFSLCPSIAYIRDLVSLAFVAFATQARWLLHPCAIGFPSHDALQSRRLSVSSGGVAWPSTGIRSISPVLAIVKLASVSFNLWVFSPRHPSKVNYTRSLVSANLINMHRKLLLLGTLLSGTYAQTLLEALSRVPALSNFTAFYQNNEAFAASYFGNESTYPITFLAPSNEAFTAYYAQHQISLFDVGPDVLLQLVQYHTLVSNLSSDNFTSSGSTGITAPTLLVNSPANNRTAGPSLAAKFGGAQRAAGQVVFIQSAGQASQPNRFKLMSRQSADDAHTAGVRSGLASTVNLQALSAEQGAWDGGRFHIVDGLLTLPTTCAETIRDAGLASLDNALNRTSLWPALDGSKNVTCLGPDNRAFQAAGNPDSNLTVEDLKGALLYHTLPEVAYSDFLVDGQEFKSLQNGTVRVKIDDSDGNRTIYFNNAKVINANVL